MEINNNKSIISHSNSSQNSKDESIKKNNSPSFRAGGTAAALYGTGAFMQWVENGGFLVSFLIQDFLGMTVPRSFAGFLRDKEITGEYNHQEGKEVLLREGLSGPCMMAVAPVSLIVAAKCGHSTSVNSQLIARYGNSLKEMLELSDFDRSLLKDADKFKTEFYRKNIENILNNTVGKENTTKESVDYILKQLQNREKIPSGTKLDWFRGKSKYRNMCMENIVSHINNIKYSKSADLNMLRKVKFGSDKFDSKKIFETTKVFDAMEKYANDAITANKKLDKLNSVMADRIKHNALGKRLITNIAMIAATLGVLSILPKIYAKSNIAPGARKKQENIQENDSKNGSITFKGRGDWLKKIGKAVEKNKSDFVANELEYNGHNFTSSLMAGLSLFGLITPRCLRAYSRAQVDDDGKKDLTELWEIIIRDITSSLAVVFAVPMITRACVTSYENKSGFVLMQKDRNKTKLQTAVDLLNPYSKAHVMTNSEITALYDNINSKEKMLNFCEYIDKNNGDLQKIISKSEEHKSVFNESTMDLKSLNKLSKAEKNKRIKSFFENIDKNEYLKKASGGDIDKLITKLMKGAGGNKNKIAAFARGMYSVPAAITTVFISPYILGWCIPRLTYKNTRRIHEKQDKEREQKNKFKTNA